MKILCFDMGGTAVKYGVWDDEKITKTGSFKTPTTWDEMKQQMRQVATKFADVEGVGISSPGSVDSKLGVIRGISAIPYIHNFEIVKELTELFNKQVTIENDANSAALAELYYGRAKDLNNVVFYIIGSGIGGAVSISKQLVKGANLFGGEIGYMLMDGKKTLSQIASPVEIAKRYHFESGKELFDLAAKGNEQAKVGAEEVYDTLARSMYNVALMLDPELILIGGGISQRDDFVSPIQVKLDHYLKANGAGDLKIKIDRCEFLQNANLIGAAVNYQNTKD